MMTRCRCAVHTADRWGNLVCLVFFVLGALYFAAQIIRALS
jgi:hypothetical protein